MRHRFMLLALLLGVVFGFVAPAQPAGAGGIDCVENFVIDPTLCDDLPPPEAPPPPPPGPSTPGRGTMQDWPGGPGMNPDQASEVCGREQTFADPAFIVQAGQPDKRIYTFTVRTMFCTLNGVVTKASVIPGLELEPFDPRIRSVTRPALYLGPNGQNTPTFVQGQDVLTEFCPDLVNCVTYRHTIYVEINALPTPSLRVVPDLFLCTPGNSC